MSSLEPRIVWENTEKLGNLLMHSEDYTIAVNTVGGDHFRLTHIGSGRTWTRDETQCLKSMAENHLDFVEGV